jgi:protease I
VRAYGLTFSCSRRNLLHAVPVNEQEASCASNRSFANHLSKLMSGELKNQLVAILATDGFDQSELTEPIQMLRRNGPAVPIISLHSGENQGTQHKEKGAKARVYIALDQANADNYTALVLPGGVANPDVLRTDPRAVCFVRQFVDAKSPIAAICRAPWTLIEADAVRGRRLTSWPSLKRDLGNAGAKWVDKEVVVDQGLVTSRKPDSLPAFCARMLEQFSSAGDSRLGKNQHPTQ